LRVLSRAFYNRATEEVARDLLGKLVVHGPTTGRIVEVEAYLGLRDLASHASRGITPRTRVMFGPPGHAYVYFIYGMYDCVNFVTEPEGTAGAVLIRALEPAGGLAIMQQRRPTARGVDDLARGPGKLTIAMGITRELNGADVTRGPLLVKDDGHVPQHRIGVGPRIGIRQCADWPLRFFFEGHPCVSGPRGGSSGGSRSPRGGKAK
jgi:DNA-3-methyladenine glycosylase